MLTTSPNALSKASMVMLHRLEASSGLFKGFEPSGPRSTSHENHAGKITQEETSNHDSSGNHIN